MHREAFLDNNLLTCVPLIPRSGLVQCRLCRIRHNRHTFSTLLAENDEDVKTVQSLMRHANSNITMNIYTHAVSSKKRRAQSKVVEMILPELSQPAASAGIA